MLRVFIPVVAFFVSFTVSGQKFLDFYFGYNMPVLKKITDHFIAVNNDYQQSYPDQGEFALSATGTGYFRGLRMNFGDDFGNGIPISLEYNYYRKRIYSNKAYFPDRNMIGQYRMRYGCHSVGFVFGGVGSFLRFGIHYNFGNVHWQKKFYPRDEFENGKWVNNVEIIELLLERTHPRWLNSQPYMSLAIFGDPTIFHDNVRRVQVPRLYPYARLCASHEQFWLYNLYSFYAV